MIKIGKLALAIVLFSTASFAASGADLWKSKCASCHGANGEGKAAMKTTDLGLPATQNQTDAQLNATITNGKNKMPEYKSKLTADEITSLVQHIRTFKK